MIRRLLCLVLGHGPFRSFKIGYWHEGELRRGRVCSCCDEIVLGEVDA